MADEPIADITELLRGVVGPLVPLTEQPPILGNGTRKPADGLSRSHREVLLEMRRKYGQYTPTGVLVRIWLEKYCGTSPENMGVSMKSWLPIVNALFAEVEPDW